MARTTIQVPDEVMARLRVMADAERTTVSVLVRQAIEKLITEHRQGCVAGVIDLFDGPPILGDRHEEDVLADLGFGRNAGREP